MNIFNTVKEVIQKLLGSYKMFFEIPLFVSVFACVLAAFFVFSYAYNTYAKTILNGNITDKRFSIIILKSLAYLINAFFLVVTLVTLLGDNYIYALFILPFAVLIQSILPVILREIEINKYSSKVFEEKGEVTEENISDFYLHLFKTTYFWFFIIASTTVYVLKILFVFVF